MSGQESRELQEARAEIARLKEQLRQRDDLIRQTFGRYLTDEVAEEILSHSADLKIGGERRVVTIMFTDLRQSTDLSERMA
ncbi:MAG: adenylate/guanylate cyclase domain-containing protein, partial [Firmicutes bacterium]|nr:adenylate/guanylate cyclase domain-containing protein [Bacillota bacterium]